MEHTEALCQLLYCVVQAEGGPSGSQGSRHSPGPVSQSPAKKQKTAPLVPPGATHIGNLLLPVCVTIHTFISKCVYIYFNKVYYYIHIYIYIYIKYIFLYIYIYIYIYISIKYIIIYIYIYIYTSRIYFCTYTYIYIDVYTYINKYVIIYIYIYVKYILLYTHIHVIVFVFYV